MEEEQDKSHGTGQFVKNRTAMRNGGVGSRRGTGTSSDWHG